MNDKRKIELKRFVSGLLFFYFLFVVQTFSQNASDSNNQFDNWPSFRGAYAEGVRNNMDLPDLWDGESLKNIKWKVKIPGLAHSSPIIWGNRLFVTSTVSSKGDTYFKHGLYGAGTASDDSSTQKWMVYCLDKKTGTTLWEKVAYEGIPIDKRHIKSTYANSTPVTNGRVVAAFFGSHGLFVFDMNGNLIWKKDLGRINIGAYDVPSYEWGSASSPIIYEDRVIVQCDTQNESFIIACAIKDGKTLWKTERDELPSWGTPTIYPGKQRVELITNSSNFIYGYDPLTGKEFWRLGGSSQITAPTPIFKDNLIVVASGRRPEKPIFVIRAGANGDISLKEKETANQYVQWSKRGRGPYMPTPIIYDGYLYALQNMGILDCYDFTTGEAIYRRRISHQGGGFSASPVAADGKLYLSGEDGDVFVVKAGPEYQLLATNEMGELIMASPALSDGILYIRAKDHLFAIGK